MPIALGRSAASADTINAHEPCTRKLPVKIPRKSFLPFSMP